MTKLLLRLFAPGDPRSARTRANTGKLAGGVGIVCNILLCLGKLLVGTVAGSVAITADAMNNLSDATSAIVTLVGFKLAEKPADADHPYGHARYEYLSGLAVAAMIVVIGFELGKSSVLKILNPAPVSFSALTAAVLLASVVVKLWLSMFHRSLGMRICSQTLLATAADSRNDVIATVAVLTAMVVQKRTGWNMDGFTGLAVAGFILYSGITLARQTISPLLGETASPELRALIQQTVESQPKILGYHDLMVHDYGPGQRFASIHVEMDQREDPLYCHELIDDLERRCLQEHSVHLVIHYDPVVTDDPELTEMSRLVCRLLQQQDDRISIHDFRMVRGQGHTNLIFDVALPAELMSRQKQIKKQLDESLNAAVGKTLYTVITFDLNA